ncbi:hypothetical protein HGRIS_006324 [Hohenbuehelia grisea]|uniref:Uncharacterized protein n=1 Tax=Hohenbuehelia grisea TaxID=104357 RepID=A0ABR3JZJ0_9AGAR
MVSGALHPSWRFVAYLSTTFASLPGPSTLLVALSRNGANPDFTADELFYQLETTHATLLIVYPEAFETALVAAKRASLPSERVVIFDAAQILTHAAGTTTGALIAEGLMMKPQYTERRLRPGEGKTKIAFLSFSSGTTGKPKAVAIPHFALIANVVQLAVHNRVNEDYAPYEDRRFRPGDVCIGVLPFYHIYGLVINLHFILFSGLSLVVIPKFNFTGMLQSIQRHRITHLMLVPPQVVLLCKHPAVKEYNLSSIRFIMVGAAPLKTEITQRIYQMFPDAHIGQAYATTMWSIDQKRGISGGAGQLLPGVIARVEKLDGSLAGYDEPGELVIKTPSVALGYANNAQATRETFVDGWVRTGDEVMIDSNKELWVVDRLKEIMKVRGFQVAPAELEGCILNHPDVSDCCVVGIPDDYSGEVPLAFVVLTASAAARAKADGAASAELKTSIMQHVADNKVKYKQLAGGVEFVDVIPKNPSGKLLRRVLREMARDLVKGRDVKAKL